MACRLGEAIFLVLLISSISIGGKIKIIEEPFSSMGGNAVRDHLQQQQEVKLVMKVEPSPVSGPDHLARLSNRCFMLTKGSFKYELCPFHNLTQREQSYRWNAFHGVLGVWKEWIIENNTFVAMKMENGERCIANILREAKIFLICGEHDELIDVTEPITCKYEVKFKTPGACPDDAFLVYPSLSNKGKSSWDIIQRKLYDEEITTQGYEKKLKEILITERLLSDPKEALLRHKSNNAQSNADNKGHARHDNARAFSSLSQCVKEYDTIFEEVEKLRSLVNASEFLDKHPEKRESVAVRVISEIIKQTQKQKQ